MSLPSVYPITTIPQYYAVLSAPDSPLPGHNETAREEHVIVGFVPKAGDPDVIRDIGRLTILHYENASNIVLNTSRK